MTPPAARRAVKVHETSGVAVFVDVPEDAAVAPAPRVDVAKLPGAEVVASSAWAAGDLSLVVGCASAPSTHFVPGLEGLVLEKTTWLSLQMIGDPTAFRQTSFETRDSARPAVRDIDGVLGGRVIAMRHLLAFVGDAPNALVCTTVCARDAGDEADVVCGAIASSLRFEGTLAPDPIPPWYVRALFWAAERPGTAVGIGGGASVFLIGLVLSRRRRYG